MGAFATLYQRSRDPLLVKLCQLVMTDEAFHHKFGKIWADRTIPKLTEEEHNVVEDWAAQCFQTLLFNLINAEQMQVVYDSCGIDWREAKASIMEAITDEDRRESLKQAWTWPATQQVERIQGERPLFRRARRSRRASKSAGIIP